MENALIYTENGGASFVSVVDAAKVFILNQTSHHTRLAYTADLKKWFDWFGTDEKSPSVQEALGFREYLTSKLASRSAARVFGTCKAFYRFLGGPNPFESLKAPSRTKNVTPEVPTDILVIKMLDLVDNPKDRLILCLLLNGLRRSEVSGLPAANIEWNTTYGTHIIKIVGKGNKERLVPANIETNLAIKAYGLSYGKWMFPMFDHEDMDKHITPKAVEYVSEKWSTKAGKKYSPHKFRHHYATRMVRAGAKLLTLSELLGHESVATTQVYVTLDMADRVEAALMDPLNSKIEVV